MKEKISSDLGLSFDDVLIKQMSSTATSRYDSQIDLSTQIAIGAPPINIPIISANMDTVTESEMATKMAQNGGLGIIHRLMSPEQQAEEVVKVKSEMTIIEDHPPMISDSATISDAQIMMKRKQRGYLIITHESVDGHKISGMITNRDFKAGREGDPICSVMTPLDRLHTVPEGTTREQAVATMKEKRVEKIPMINAQGNLLGVYTLKDDELLGKYPKASTDNHGRLMVGAAIGVRQQVDIERAHQLEDAGVDVLVLDVAHGALGLVEMMLNELKVHQNIKVPIIVGNISTKETAKYVVDMGADGVKVGVGPGYVCDTRDIAGVGMPQITAVMSAYEAVKNYIKIPIIADGGIRKPGDFAKAIAAGADSAMIGSLFAGTIESPGEIVNTNGVLQKMVRGMSSKEANESFRQINGNTSKSKRVPEGSTKFVPVQGSVEEVLFWLIGGLRSALTYTNSFSVKDMHKNAQFIRITPAGSNEQHRSLR